MLIGFKCVFLGKLFIINVLNANKIHLKNWTARLTF